MSCRRCGPVTFLSMVSLSTHVLDGAAGGPRVGVPATLETLDGVVVASGRTDAMGRIAALAPDVGPGLYRLRWTLGDTEGFLQEVAVVVHLGQERHYHVPLLASDASAVSYLGV
jgi:5-hydroxyisourate hydrolase